MMFGHCAIVLFVVYVTDGGISEDEGTTDLASTLSIVASDLFILPATLPDHFCAAIAKYPSFCPYTVDMASLPGNQDCAEFENR